MTWWLRFSLVLFVFSPLVNAESTDVCQEYAKVAVEKYKESLEFNCNFTGTDWSFDLDHHYNWCKANPGLRSGKETSRVDELASCQIQYVKNVPAESKLIVPTLCNDPDNNKLPVKYTVERVTNMGGELRLKELFHDEFDLNKDGHPDYLFFERLPGHSELDFVICLSSQNKQGAYKRIKPGFTDADAFGGISIDNSSSSVSFSQDDEILTFSNSYWGHNWGGDTLSEHYKFDMGQQAFLLQRIEHDQYSGDGGRMSGEAVFDLVNKHYSKSYACGWDEACEDIDEQGDLVIDSGWPTLLHNSSVMEGSRSLPLELPFFLVPDFSATR